MLSLLSVIQVHIHSGTMYSNLDSFYNRSKLAVIASMDSLIDNDMGTSIDIRKKAFYRLLQSPYLNAPKSPVYSQAILAEQIELSFYLKMLLDTDSLHESHRKLVSRKVVSRNTQRQITESPNSPDYPKLQMTRNKTTAHYQTIFYDTLGKNISIRMNELHKNYGKNKSKIIETTLGRYRSDRTVLQNAENTLNYLTEKTIGKALSRIKPIRPLKN